MYMPYIFEGSIDQVNIQLHFLIQIIKKSAERKYENITDNEKTKSQTIVHPTQHREIKH